MESMLGELRKLMKETAVYGLSTVVGRLLNFLLTPLYTHALRPADLFINTTLSRIWMELGDKPKAEHFGAQARMAGWKEELKNPPPKAQ